MQAPSCWLKLISFFFFFLIHLVNIEQFHLQQKEKAVNVYQISHHFSTRRPCRKTGDSQIWRYTHPLLHRLYAVPIPLKSRKSRWGRIVLCYPHRYCTIKSKALRYHDICALRIGKVGLWPSEVTSFVSYNCRNASGILGHVEMLRVPSPVRARSLQ